MTEKGHFSFDCVNLMFESNHGDVDVFGTFEWVKLVDNPVMLDLHRFLEISRGSCVHLYISEDLMLG